MIKIEIELLQDETKQYLVNIKFHNIWIIHNKKDKKDLEKYINKVLTDIFKELK